MTNAEIINAAAEMQRHAATSDGPIDIASFVMGAQWMRTTLAEAQANELKEGCCENEASAKTKAVDN